MDDSPMILVNTHEAKTKLSALLAAVELRHEVVRICRNGRAVAMLIPIAQTQDPLKQHSELQGVQIKYDPTAPLTDDEWPTGAR